jgi:hypothetical protein
MAKCQIDRSPCGDDRRLMIADVRVVGNIVRAGESGRICSNGFFIFTVSCDRESCFDEDSLECGLLGYNADVSQTQQAQDFVRATRQMEGADNANFTSPSASAAPAANGIATTAGAAQAMDMASVRARQYEQIRRGIRPEQRMKELKEGMVGVVENCLRERGYVQFRLTDEQRETLSHLDRGSEERREFLYRLASNEDVLRAQALPSAAS